MLRQQGLGITMASLLERRFSFYAAYHQNEANQNIHIVCVPLIYWSALILVSVLLPCSLSTVIPGVPEAINVVGVAIPIDASFVAVLVYFLYYIVLSPVLAVSALAAGRATPSPLTLLCCAPVLQLCTTFLLSTALVGATVAVLQLGPTLAVRVAAVVHVVGWLAQFYGHGHYEGTLATWCCTSCVGFPLMRRERDVSCEQGVHRRCWTA